MDFLHHPAVDFDQHGAGDFVACVEDASASSQAGGIEQAAGAAEVIGRGHCVMFPSGEEDSLAAQVAEAL